MFQKFQGTNLNKAVIGGEVVPHRIPPTFVVSFEKREEGTDLLEDLRIKQKHQYGCATYRARTRCISSFLQLWTKMLYKLNII